MYEVEIYNNGVKTVIHSINPSVKSPHLFNLPFKESLSKADELSFSIPSSNVGYSLIKGLTTKVKVIDTRDNSIVFTGRVLTTKDGMSSDGKFTNEVLCEGAMNYLNDSNTRRWNFTNQTPTQILTYLLNQHNSKADSSRQIQLGTIEVTQPITIDTNYETTLNTIITKLHNILGGDFRVRETSGILYLDYLIAQGTNNEVEIRIGHNLKEIIREYDPMDIITRAVPLGYGEGINQLGIESVNGGVDYIENSVSKAKYGIIEGCPPNKDIQNADTLKIWGQKVLEEKSQPRLTYSIGSLDLSVLLGHENEKYEAGDTLRTIVDFMNVNVYARVIERVRDLILKPWDPTLTISTRAITLTDQIVDLKQRNLTLENAPQGNTCIFAIPKAENADATHPITLDLDIPKETININRVYINLHGRKFRADSKGIGGGGGTITTTEGGGAYQESSKIATQTTTVYMWRSPDGEVFSIPAPTIPGDTRIVLMPIEGAEYHLLDRYQLDHQHNNEITIPAIDIPDHPHDMILEDHTHEQEYGIYESTYPKNAKIKVNGVDLGVNYGDGTNEFDGYDIDITPHVNIGNNKIEITTEQNGRIEAIVYSQIFIQTK